MKRKTITIILIMIITISIGFITVYLNKNSNKAVDVNIGTREIIDKITNEISQNEDAGLIDLTDEQFINNYNINNDIIDEYSAKTQLINIKANELAIIKLKDKKDIDGTVKKLIARSKNIANDFKDYFEDQYRVAMDPLIITKDKYILFSVSENNGEIKKIFEAFFN